MPPRFTKHHGFMLTSASRTGSQKPIAIPGLRPHRHTGRSGLSGSGRLDGQMSSPPIEIGNRQDQQISVIGLTKLPVQRPGPASAMAGVAVAKPRMAASMSASFLKRVIGCPPFRWQRDFADLEQAALLAHACGHRPDPEPFREFATLVEIEAALAGLHQPERRALHQDQLGIGVLLERPGELVWIVAVEEQEIGAKADARSEEHTSELQS